MFIGCFPDYLSALSHTPIHYFLDKLCRNSCNLVPRVLRLFGQRVGATRDSGEFEKI